MIGYTVKYNSMSTAIFSYTGLKCLGKAIESAVTTTVVAHVL